MILPQTTPEVVKAPGLFTRPPIVTPDEYRRAMPLLYNNFFSRAPAPDAGNGGEGGDPFWDQVVFMMNMNGTDGGQDAIDHAQGLSITWVGNSVLTDAQTLYQPTSLHITGSGDQGLQIPHSGELSVQDNQTTYEIRWRSTASGGDRALFSCAQNKPTVQADNMENMQTVLVDSTGSLILNNIVDQNLSANVNYETALEIDAANQVGYSYFNGTLYATHDLSASTTDDYTSTSDFSLGFHQFVAFPNPFEGFIYEFRITKALRYGGASYTPTGETWPTS